MKIINIFLYTILVLNVSLLKGSTPDPLTLQDALKEALRANLDLKVFYQNQLMAQSDITTAGLRNNPQLNLIGDVLPAPGERFNPFNKSFGASLSFPLDIANHRARRIDIANEEFSAVNFQFMDQVRQTVQKVKTAYYAALAKREKLELANINLSSLDSLVKLNRIRAQQLAIPEIDVTRSEFVREQFRSEVQSEETDYLASLIDLQVLMGRSSTTDSIALASDIEDLTPPDTISIENALSYAIEHRPDFQAIIKQTDVEKANQRLQQSLNSIELSISGDYSQQQSTNFMGISMSLNLPVFNRNQGEIEKSIYRIEQNELSIQSLKVSMRAEIQKAHEDMINLWKMVEKQKEILIPQAEQILKTIEYSYRSGNTTMLDYLEAQRSFTETRINYIDTLYRYHLSQEAFETAISKENF
ncbi:MAG: TolC family protein [Bacteroidota bacterium]|nr:TolC family protein [Bacteroidota bacterium]